MFRTLILCLVFFPGLAIGATNTIIYDCALKEFTNDNWIPPRIILTIDEGTMTGTVYDGTVHEVYGKPINAQITRRNAKSVQYKWDVDGVSGAHNSSLNGGFNLILNQKNLTATMRVYVKGFDNEPYGSGKCQVIPN